MTPGGPYSEEEAINTHIILLTTGLQVLNNHHNIRMKPQTLGSREGGEA